MKNVLARCFFLLFVGAQASNAAWIPASATDFTATTAHGLFNGAVWNASTSSDSPFLGIHLSSGAWDVDHSLPPNGLMLTASDVNAGDFQEFTFETPVTDAYFYIENFDSSSVANITSDATSLQLFAASSSISYSPTTDSSGVLSTSNTGYDGEGDVILHFTGQLTTLRLDFTDGTGANGVFYGFAQDSSTVSSPEPASITGALLGVAGIVCWLRRRRRSIVAD